MTPEERAAMLFTASCEHDGSFTQVQCEACLAKAIREAEDAVRRDFEAGTRVAVQDAVRRERAACLGIAQQHRGCCPDVAVAIRTRGGSQ